MKTDKLMKYTKYLIFSCIAVFCSCEYEIDYNEDLPEDKLVIAAFAEENEALSFKVFHSAKPGVYHGESYEDMKKANLSYEDAIVKDAIVTMHVNNNEYTASYNETDGYTFSYIPQPLDKIQITISHPNYPTVESNLDFSMKEPDIDSFACYFRTKDYEKQLIIYFEINDDGGDNYYMINNTALLSNYFNYKILSESHSGVYFDNSSAWENKDDEGYNEYGVFANTKFKGQKYTLKLAYNIDYFYKITEEDLKKMVSLARIDKNAYDYLYSLNNYMHSWGLNINPITVKNAWDNAYGFIGIKKTKKIPSK